MLLENAEIAKELLTIHAGHLIPWTKPIVLALTPWTKFVNSWGCTDNLLLHVIKLIIYTYVLKHTELQLYIIIP